MHLDETKRTVDQKTTTDLFISHLSFRQQSHINPDQKKQPLPLIIIITFTYLSTTSNYSFRKQFTCVPFCNNLRCITFVYYIWIFFPHDLKKRSSLLTSHVQGAHLVSKCSAIFLFFLVKYPKYPLAHACAPHMDTAG